MKTARAILIFGAAFSLGSSARAQTLGPQQQLAREIYKELVEINTSESVGNTTAAAEAMLKRLRDAGFSAADAAVLGAEPRKGNLVARLRGNGTRRPILLAAHLDVVEARREDWSFDPFKRLEQDGYFNGRGTSDDKAMAAIFVANLIRYKQEKFVPDRDIIVVLTADEELGDVPTNGMDWLLKNHRALIDAEFALNEGGGVSLRNGKALANRVQASEKISVTYRLEVKNPGAILIFGTLGQTWRIQYSENLGSWSNLDLVQLNAIPTLYPDSNATGKPRRFYRGLRIP